jgi:glucose 1-dehydrogenase
LIVFHSQLMAAMTYSIEGKRVLVTGSSGGIGKGIALELGRRGAQVIVHYNMREKEAYATQKELGEQCLGVLHCDFREPDSIPSFMDRVQECCKGQGLDILINNAGVVKKLALEDDDQVLSIWHETLAVNLHAPNLLSKLALPQMKTNTNGGGVIINVSSIHGEKSNEYMGAYAASKSALDSLTRTMAIEFAPHNVRVNAISPGVVPVERTAQAFQDPAIRGAWEERMPLGRVGTVEQVAQACIPLIENEWITGSILQIDGGLMARANLPARARPSPET